jgi:hypothetical protein
MNKDTIKKIGSIPLGYNENDILFMEDNKIFIAKADKKSSTISKKKKSEDK